MNAWDKAMTDGYFRYDLSAVRTKIIPGKYKFITQVCRTLHQPNMKKIQDLAFNLF